jgi:hypothetical protein
MKRASVITVKIGSHHGKSLGESFSEKVREADEKLISAL